MSPLTPADFPALASALAELAHLLDIQARQDGLSERDRAARMVSVRNIRTWEARVRAAIPSPAAG